MFNSKKHFGLIVLLLAGLCASLQSCDSDEVEVVSNPPEELSTRSIRLGVPKNKFEVTQRMAETFISSNKENPPIVSVEPYGIDGVTCFYIFNFENGFKVVSADTRIQPILAENDSDNLVPSETDNPGVKVWLEDTADRIRVLKENNPDTGEDYSELWSAYRLPETTDITTTRSEDVDSVWVLEYNSSSSYTSFNANVGPILSTEWGQGSPWNSKMPKINGTKCLTGCVAVATAQVLYYFHNQNNTPNDFWHSISIQSTQACPSHTNCIHVSLNKSDHTNNSSRWSSMTSNTDNVSYLMLDLGERLDMHYGTTNSGVTLGANFSIPNLTSCGITSSFDSFSFPIVRSDLLNEKPVIITASQNYNGSFHTWVIDGCKDYTKKYTITATYYCIHPDELVNYPNNVGVLSYDEMLSLYPDATGGVYQVSQTTYDHQQSLHMNWGWDGNLNGWYNFLDPTDMIYSLYVYNRVIHYSINTTQLN